MQCKPLVLVTRMSLQMLAGRFGLHAQTGMRCIRAGVILIVGGRVFEWTQTWTESQPRAGACATGAAIVFPGRSVRCLCLPRSLREGFPGRSIRKGEAFFIPGASWIMESIGMESEGGSSSGGRVKKMVAGAGE